jgi:hypothetical protein
LNRHSVRKRILNPSRLPIPPFGLSTLMFRVAKVIKVVNEIVALIYNINYD